MNRVKGAILVSLSLPCLIHISFRLAYNYKLQGFLLYIVLTDGHTNTAAIAFDIIGLKILPARKVVTQEEIKSIIRFQLRRYWMMISA